MTDPSLPSSAAQPFSYGYYEEMLRTCIDRGFKITSFEKFDDRAGKTLILRHDVDYTLDGLLEFAEIEARLGCTASYLFRVHADEYNLFAPVAVHTARSIKRLGHELGLHFEAMNVGRALAIAPQRLLEMEKQVIETILDQQVLTCSEHREISGVVHGTALYRECYDPYAAGFRFYAMDDRYCKAMKYLSDSNASWREGDPTKHLDRHDRLQVLVHPDWWFETDLLLKGPYYHPRSTHP